MEMMLNINHKKGVNDQIRSRTLLYKATASPVLHMRRVEVLYHNTVQTCGGKATN